MTETVYEEHEVSSRCECTHRYPHHIGNGTCLICPCQGFTPAAGPVLRQRTGPDCPSCGAELLITPAGQPCERCRRQGDTP